MYQRVIAVMFSFFLSSGDGVAQLLAKQLDFAVQNLSADEQFKHAIIGLYVIDSKTGQIIIDRNGQLGLSPASCQKVITSVTAFELLGQGYQFKTFVTCNNQIANGKLLGNLYVTGCGDPTLGSSRWKSTNEEIVFKKIISIVRQKKISFVSGDLVCNDSQFTTEALPSGWVWEDIGNYYGAGAWGLNWRENQYDITFKTGIKLNDSTTVISTKPIAVLNNYTVANFIKTGSKGSGDNGYLYSAPFGKNIIARGTIPITENGFTISGSMPDPPGIFITSMATYLKENGIGIAGKSYSNSAQLANNLPTSSASEVLDSILSPTVDSINYWFLKKSVNLFGEALIKAMAYEKFKNGSTDTGIALVKEYWSKHGIEKSALNMIDGSGLSPANRITANSLVSVLQFAKSRPWFSLFYNALPEINGIKMKDGYISGVRSYTGYVKSKNGTDYIFAFIVNNFDGSASTAREKIWKLLNILK
jgi:D-alanyl-D-alanine carboxypeptidase/D-alanyl-D-alanine-endopeptidase (penicillin-binding protein 4)